MSAKVHSASYNRVPLWYDGHGDTHTLVQGFTLSLYVGMPDGEDRIVHAYFDTGFTCDGLSVPWLFRWFLKSWDKDNPLYNLAGAFHDWLYSSKGAGGMFTREECDDIFRGILRESGKCRGKAGIADKAVEWFAGGKAHWGNDGYGIRDKVTLAVI